MSHRGLMGKGKVILFGEHAVVYGIPAIAVGIDRGARAEANAMSQGPSRLRVVDWNIAVDASDTETPLARAFRGLLDETRAAGACLGEVSVDAQADLPPGGGLGCSAAIGVAVARALDQEATSETIAMRAGAWERVFHGNPSGVDAAVSAMGGCIQFERRDGAPVIERVRVPGVFHLCIGNSGQASSTLSMVNAVARLKERRPDTTQKTFDAIHTLVKNARLAIEAGDRNAVGQLLDLNQMLLSGLFVSTPEIEQMCASARSAGALGAKLTGAGGGGCVVAFVDTAEIGASVLSAWKRDGFDGFATTFGAAEPLRRAPRQLVEDSP
jgi:mevalonate kinase